MKTYVIEAIKRIKRFSEEFNVKTTLCDKTWTVFNDSGENEVYIFQPNGTAYVTNNGIGIKGQWEWVSANNSLIINKDGNVIMLHPEFIDNTVLALTLDGTNKMAFLIEQGNKKAFEAKTLAQLEQYFIEKEKLLIAEQNHRIEEENRKRLEEENRRKAEEERKREEDRKELLKKIESYRKTSAKKEAKILIRELETNKCAKLLAVFYFVGLPVVLILLNKYNENLVGLAIFICTFVCLILLIIAINIDTRLSNKRINKWKEDNPNDPRNDYL